MQEIAVVVPNNRPEAMQPFMEAWQPLFDKHNVIFILVKDGETPIVNVDGVDTTFTLPEELKSNFCAGVRNYGFAYVALHLPRVKYIITLDDDETPIDDPIQDHIDQLQRRVPISWISTSMINTSLDYMRGFPYGVRSESPVMLSHGVWEGVYDYDAPTQLHAKGKVEFYRGPIPKGALFPMCGMNLAFRRELLPYMYFAPVGDYKGAERFDDIYLGVFLKKKMDELNYACVTGYARVMHNRASNVFNSLEREATGIKHNEELWKNLENYSGDKWFDDYRIKINIWYNYINEEIKG